MNMKAALLYGKEDLRLSETACPKPGVGEVLVRVKAAAVCGTDVRMFRNGYKGICEKSPLALGHEFSGVIEEVGEEVNTYRPRMRVAVAPNIGCGICERCISGSTHLCAQLQAIGINIHGAFSEFVRIPFQAVRQGNLADLGEGLTFESAALAEPLACVYNAFERAALSPGDSVLIIGAGPIGLMHARLAKLAGAAPVFLTDISQERLSRVPVIDPSFVPLSSETLKDQIAAMTDGRGVEICITAAPSAQAQSLALELVGINGRVIFFGGLPPGKSRVELDTNQIHYKQITATGTTRSSLRQYRKALNLISSGRVRVDDLITHRCPLEGIHSAIDRAARRQGLKQIVLFE